MTKLVCDYLARCMEDPEFATAYRELEAEYQAERARIHRDSRLSEAYDSFQVSSEAEYDSKFTTTEVDYKG